MSKCECENCLHCDVCYKRQSSLARYCDDYKSKSLLVELPCQVGDTVYCANFITKEIQEFKVEYIELDKYANWFILDIKNEYISKFSFERIGTLFFLTKDEAEKNLKEMGV